MPYPIDKKLVIAVSTSALFDMEESDSIYRAKGVEAYRKYQEKKIDEPLDKGVAFPFIKRILNLNNALPNERPIEVVIFSKNSPESGLRAFRSISHYQLDISRACFLREKATSNIYLHLMHRYSFRPILKIPEEPFSQDLLPEQFSTPK